VFRADRTFEAVGVSLRQIGATIEGEAVGICDATSVAKQVARILSLDVDGSDWPELGRRDPPLGALQARYPGARPVSFPSPYEAGVWGILAQRVPMRQAAKLKLSLAESCGDPVEIEGRRLSVFPAPQKLLSVKAHAGLSAEKLGRLKAVAEAALEGWL